MRVLVAPDKFKGTLTAVAAADTIAAVLVEHGHDVVTAPMADGGDGTLDAMVAAGARSRMVSVEDAHGRARQAPIAVLGDRTVIELAAVCGLATVLDLPLDPWTASSRGLGLAARAAIESGAGTIVICLGGSASVDGGIGMLQALGFAVRDSLGHDVTPDLRGLLAATSIAPPAPRPDVTLPDVTLPDVTLPDVTLPGYASPDVTWHALVDVTAPLCGPTGAIAFAPQKGVAADRLPSVDEALARWAGLLTGLRGIDPTALPGAGAAGGVGAALIAALGARVERGADAIADLVGLDAELATCDAVITGEGRFDATTASGKAPRVVIERAGPAHVPVHVIAGSIASDAPLDDVASATSCQPGIADPRASLVDAVHRWCTSVGAGQ